MRTGKLKYPRTLILVYMFHWSCKITICQLQVKIGSIFVFFIVTLQQHYFDVCYFKIDVSYLIITLFVSYLWQEIKLDLVRLGPISFHIDSVWLFSSLLGTKLFGSPHVLRTIKGWDNMSQSNSCPEFTFYLLM